MSVFKLVSTRILLCTNRFLVRGRGFEPQFTGTNGPWLSRQKSRIEKEERNLAYLGSKVCLIRSVLLEALSTVDRPARSRHKRHFRISAAVRAFDLRHLSRGTVTSILITHFVFHRPYSLVIRKIILASIIGTSLTALPSSTQVTSSVYCWRRG